MPAPHSDEIYYPGIGWTPIPATYNADKRGFLHEIETYAPVAIGMGLLALSQRQGRR